MHVIRKYYLENERCRAEEQYIATRTLLITMFLTLRGSFKNMHVCISICLDCAMYFSTAQVGHLSDWIDQEAGQGHGAIAEEIHNEWSHVSSGEEDRQEGCSVRCDGMC